jgi:hypothetical protein
MRQMNTVDLPAWVKRVVVGRGFQLGDRLPEDASDVGDGLPREGPPFDSDRGDCIR